MTRTLTATAACLVLVLTGCADQGSQGGPLPSAEPGIGGAEPAPSSTTPSAPSAPARLQMPTIGFDKPVTSLGLTKAGEINPPRGVVQWYNKSVPPGQVGISVIAGHVLYQDPDVFYRLHELSKGDILTVRYGNGSSKHFKVYAEESINKHKLQTDSRVWGQSDKPVLALITCDSASQVVDHHHVDNYVVWAAPV